MSAEHNRQLDAEIVALPPSSLARKAWLLTLVELILSRFSGGWGYDPKAKVVIRYRGKERLLFKEPTLERAKEKAERVTTEFETMSLSDWCARYEVPADFFSDKM